MMIPTVASPAPGAMELDEPVLDAAEFQQHIEHSARKIQRRYRKSMASTHGDEEDEERQSRWPLHTRRGSVVRIAIDSNSEDSSMEEDYEKEDEWAEEEEEGQGRQDRGKRTGGDA